MPICPLTASPHHPAQGCAAAIRSIGVGMLEKLKNPVGPELQLIIVTKDGLIDGQQHVVFPRVLQPVGQHDVECLNKVVQVTGGKLQAFQLLTK
ncbi:hypothetical protein PJE062_913 [Pseudovibrio sp. JE062]|nr:hypothetical protein PJE062_913 [Pseudovibrio sp. JE062]